MEIRGFVRADEDGRRMALWRWFCKFMKAILQENDKFILRFDKGEEVLEGLKNFMNQENISACSFYGIGACSEVDLGYFNEHLKGYHKKPYCENLEIVSFIGNGSISGGQPAIHAHGAFARHDFSTLAGHVFKLVVSVTCELLVVKFNGALARQANPDFNLNLLV